MGSEGDFLEQVPIARRAKILGNKIEELVKRLFPIESFIFLFSKIMFDFLK